jgi:hypothetical protein
MGRAKDWEMEQQERGWLSVPGKYVCPECFEEDFLRHIFGLDSSGTAR